MSYALPLTSFISTSSTRQRKHRTLSAQFGDGYGQDAPDGINPQYDEWQVIYQNLTQTDRDTLWVAIDAVGSWNYLTWTAFGDSVSKKWKITSDGISESIQSGNIYSVSFKLRQIY